MANKITLEITETDLRNIIKSLHATKVNDKLGGKLFSQLLSNTSFPRRKLSDLTFDAALANNPQLMQAIIHAISLITGTEETDIAPDSILLEVGITPTKLGQLRVAVNQYLQQQGSSKSISSAEIGSATTVQDLYDIAIKKLS